MSRRHLLLFSLLAGTAVGVASAVAALLLSPPTAITRENYVKIRMGMPRNEVEAMLGAPHRYGDDSFAYRWYKVARGQPTEWAVGDFKHRSPDAHYSHTATWYSLETRIELDYDENDCVCGSLYLFAFDPHK